MQDSYVRGVAVLAEHYGIASSNVYSHIEWVTANFKNMKNLRRIDPAGPSRFGSINSADSWDMDKFRAEVEVQRGNASKATPPPKSSTVKRDAADGDLYVIKARDTWWSIADKTMGDPGTNWKVLADANGGEDAMLYIGGVLTIPGGVASSATAPKKVDFPGEAKPGDKGAVVLAWQEALIERGALNDTPGNRDSDFGTGTERIVRELKESWGWSDADGIADSKTWKRLHEAV